MYLSLSYKWFDLCFVECKSIYNSSDDKIFLWEALCLCFVSRKICGLLSA